MTGVPYTIEGAWDLVLQELESGCEIEQICLRKPPNKTGFVLRVSRPALPEIYIKLQLGTGTVIGRSFHDDRREEDE